MRIIDAEALKTKIQKIKAEALEHGFAPESVCGDILLNFLDNAPTIEAKPIVHASWTEVSGGRIICDHCGEYPLYDYFGRIKQMITSLYSLYEMVFYFLHILLDLYMEPFLFFSFFFPYSHLLFS